VLNLYPYNSGHLMLVPFRHLASYDELTVEEAADVAQLTQHALRALRHATGAQGFNVGMNLGTVGRRGHRRPPAPARRPALGWRHELHAGGRAHARPAAAAARHASAARPGVVRGLSAAQTRAGAGS
jgi:hypothetical protein